MLTNRERHKSAPYLRLKNTNDFKVSSFLYYSTQKKNISWTNWRAERGDPFGFLTSIFATHLKLKGVPTPWGIFFEKSLIMPKKLKWGTLQSRPVMYVTRGKRKNLFGPVV